MVFFDGKFYLFYTGYPIEFGVDGHSAFIVAEPGPVVHNGEIFLYFTTFGADAELGASLQVIGLFRSDDGTLRLSFFSPACCLYLWYYEK